MSAGADGGAQRLWILHHATVFGGADRLVLKVARHAAGLGIDVGFVCEPASELAELCRADGIGVVATAYPDFGAGLARAPVTLARLRRALRAAPPDARLVTSGPRPQAWGSLARSGRRFVHLAHEQETARRLTARAVLPRTGEVVAVGSNSARAYQDALGVPVRSVNNVLDADELAAAFGNRRRRLAAGPPRLGALVRLVPQKGVLELLDELAARPQVWSDLRIGAIPQDAAYGRAVEARARASDLAGRVRLVGPVTDAGAFLAQVDRLIVPSVGTEGQPTTILEALAHGVGAVVREPIWSEDYAGLAVVPYRGAADIGAALAAPAPPATADELERRFGPGQALAGLLA